MDYFLHDFWWNTFLVVFWALDFQGLGAGLWETWGRVKKEKNVWCMKAVDNLMLLIQLSKINTTAFEKTVCLWGIFFGIYWMADGNVI